MKHVAFAEAEIKKSALDRACGPLKRLVPTWICGNKLGPRIRQPRTMSAPMGVPLHGDSATNK